MYVFSSLPRYHPRLLVKVVVEEAEAEQWWRGGGGGLNNVYLNAGVHLYTDVYARTNRCHEGENMGKKCENWQQKT